MLRYNLNSLCALFCLMWLKKENHISNYSSLINENFEEFLSSWPGVSCQARRLTRHIRPVRHLP